MSNLPEFLSKILEKKASEEILEKKASEEILEKKASEETEPLKHPKADKTKNHDYLNDLKKERKYISDSLRRSK